MEPWYARVVKQLKNFANGILDNTTGDDPELWVQTWLHTENIAELAGSPNGNDFPPSGPYRTYLVNLWGRRFAYFLTQVVSGLEVANNVSNETTFKITQKQLSAISGQIASRYLRGINVTDGGPEIDLTDNHITYLDPTLFSALFLIHRADSDSLYLSPEQRQNIRDKIRTELERYTNGGLGPLSPSLRDESNVWWGVIRLLREEESNFKIGKYLGFEGATKILQFLASHQKPIFPLQQDALLEGTFDIYGEIRTRLMIILNSVFLMSKPCLCSDNLATRLQGLIKVHHEWIRSAKQPSVFEHCYTLGLTAEAVGMIHKHSRNNNL